MNPPEIVYWYEFKTDSGYWVWTTDDSDPRPLIEENEELADEIRNVQEYELKTDEVASDD